jgi:hypothetical protein
VGTRAESAPAGLPPAPAEPSRRATELPREPGRP